MAAKQPNSAPETATLAVEGDRGRSPTTSKTEGACSAQNPDLALMFGEPVDWRIVEAILAEAEYDSYRAALARGVWWG